MKIVNVTVIVFKRPCMRKQKLDFILGHYLFRENKIKNSLSTTLVHTSPIHNRLPTGLQRNNSTFFFSVAFTLTAYDDIHKAQSCDCSSAEKNICQSGVRSLPRRCRKKTAYVRRSTQTVNKIQQPRLKAL
jgi:hypothetical protein